MTALLAWIWTPLLLLGLSLGWGLLADVALRTRLPPALLAPAGLALIIVVASLGFRLRLPTLVFVALVAGALAGLVAGRERLRRGPWHLPGLVAAGSVYALYMAPIVFSGEPTWAGYNFVNDTASNFVLADVIEHNGVAAPGGGSGTAANAANLLNSGYPLGAFSLLAGLRPLTGAPLEAVYQPVMAMVAGLGAMSLTEIGRRAGLRAPGAALAATLAMGGVLLYRYVLHGAIKEVLLVVLLSTAVALAGVVVDRRLAVRSVIPVAVTALAAILVFSAAAGAYVLALGVATAAMVALAPDRPSWSEVGRLLAVGVGVLVLVLLPVLGSTLDFVAVIDRVFSASDGLSEGALGQLLRPLPVTEAAGVWVARDYRLPPDSQNNLNTLLVVCSITAAAAGAVVAVRRRVFGPLLLLATVVLPALALTPLASSYIDAKLLVVVTPAVVFLGLFAAVTGLQSARKAWKAVGAVALLAVAGGVLLSDLYGYREARNAPADRVEAMRDVAAHVPDRGLYLFNEWEEFGKFFMRSARVNPASEVESPRLLRLRVDRGLPANLPRTSPRREPRFGRWFDLDAQTPPFLGRFAGIIMRRSPAASRPPASYRLAYRNRYYELWLRDRPVRVRGHLPLQGRDRATALPSCARVRSLARTARPGDRLVAARPARVARLSPLTVARPRAWRPGQEPAGPEGSVIPYGPGSLRGALTAGGEQRVWIKASGGRAVRVLVDGRSVGSVREINTPGQWLEVGRVRLPPGRRAHSIEVMRGGATLRPDDAQRGFVGPVALQRAAPGRLVSVAPRRSERLCGRSWDWIELVAPRR